MTQIHAGRHTAVLQQDDELVVFIIGMRINRIRQVRRWMPVARAMGGMLGELHQDRALGLLGSPRTFRSGRTILLVQYWRSFEHLERYAKSSEHDHLPAWRRFNQVVRDNGSVGIFHETYRVRASDVENIYSNMPAFGLGLVGELVPVGAGRQSAAARMNVREDGALPVEPY